MAKPEVLMIGPYPPWEMPLLDDQYTVHRFWEISDKPSWLAAHGGGIRAVATRGDLTCDASLINALPALEIIACFGVGVDGIDLAAARARGIRVSNTPDVLTDDVADLAIGLMLGIARQIPRGDAHVRAGLWKQGSLPLGARVSGKRLGILGLGRIGLAIALRGAAFGMTIGYCNRSERHGIPYRRFAAAAELASNSDFLVAAVSANPATAGMINADVLRALGPEGYFINVSRGSVVDEEALIAALRAQAIKGAALDVFNNEPAIDSRFIALENTVLLPHVGTATLETRQAMGRLVRDNLSAHFTGRPLLTQVL